MNGLTRAIIEDVQELRGANVHIFGQPTKLESEIDELIIDIIEVLENLEIHEIDEMMIEEYDEENDDYKYHEVDDVDKYLDHLEEMGYLEEGKSDNSYNWASPISNHFNFAFYKDTLRDKVLVAFRVHRYGDVRANYTSTTLFEFDFKEDFLEALSESNKYINVELDDERSYNVDINIFNDGFEVYNEEGHHIKDVYCCDMDELKEELKALSSN